MPTTVLTFIQTYLPGFKGGGPIRSISNMVEALGDEFRFLIVTADRDDGDDEPYEIATGPEGWKKVGKAEVLYLPPSDRGLRDIWSIMKTVPHDVLYLNSFFSPDFTIKPLLARRLLGYGNKPCVVAPRGEFSPAALALKRWKKRPYIAAARAIRLYGGVTWEASTEYDAAEIRSAIGLRAGDVRLAMNIPDPAGIVSEADYLPRQAGDPLRICFVSRVTAKKNVDFAIEILKSITIPVRFQIYGPIQDHQLHQQCLQKIAELPEQVDVTFMGSISHEEVPRVFAASDLFLFPTRGENYGHVIAESLAAGTPVLVSDRTPWRNLEHAGVGWDLPLEAGVLAFREKILEADVLSRATGREWRRLVRSYASDMAGYRGRVDAARALLSF
ncbi:MULTISPECIES: glycosyltransferase family 4 protein [unclassified Devosia]|uniref:glycosyltransferase family 4 protein n=1 Tax=unclassified Devosia TaxID=196773 RepID=UPI000B3302CF|nr:MULTISPECIES: glycosyltransferase family 4 protein [unclassified Devosia]MBN9364450.1 glycosyltransferase family 4 protein [Devosia sp.]